MLVSAVTNTHPIINTTPIENFTLNFPELFCKVVEYTSLQEACSLSLTCKVFHRRIDGFELLTFFVTRNIFFEYKENSTFPHERGYFLPTPLKKSGVDPAIVDSFVRHAPALLHKIAQLSIPCIGKLLQKRMEKFLTVAQRCKIWRNYLNKCERQLDISPFVGNLSRPIDKKIVGICRARREIQHLNLGSHSLEDLSLVRLLPKLQVLHAPHVSFQITDLPILENVVSLTLGLGINSLFGSGNETIDLSIFSKWLKELRLNLWDYESNEILTSPNLNIVGNSTIEKLTISDGTILRNLHLGDFPNLKELIIFTRFPISHIDFHQCPQLERLVIKHYSLLPPFIVDESLMNLDLSQCSALRDLEIDVLSLTINGIENCKQLVNMNARATLFTLELPDLPNLIKLKFFGTGLTAQGLAALQELNVTTVGPHGGQHLNISNLPKLKKLIVWAFLEELNLAHLQTEYLCIKGPSIKNITLPRGIRKLKLTSVGVRQIDLEGQALEKLSLLLCEQLTDIYELEQQRDTLTSLEICDTNLRSINLHDFYRLTTLSISECSNLRSLYLSGCTALVNTDLPGIQVQNMFLIHPSLPNVKYSKVDRCRAALANTPYIDEKTSNVYKACIAASVVCLIIDSSMVSDFIPTIIVKYIPDILNTVGILGMSYGAANFAYRFFKNY